MQHRFRYQAVDGRSRLQRLEMIEQIGLTVTC